MPAPVVLYKIGLAAKLMFKKWPTVLVVIGLVTATGFTINSMINQMGQTALSLWSLLAIACFFFLLKEFIRAWVKVKINQDKNKEIS